MNTNNLPVIVILKILYQFFVLREILLRVMKKNKVNNNCKSLRSECKMNSYEESYVQLIFFLQTYFTGVIRLFPFPPQAQLHVTPSVIPSPITPVS